MLRSNLHTHSLYCDGKAPMNTYIEDAIKSGFSSLGFSSHAPLPFKSSWAMKGYKLRSYLDEIEELKKINKDKIELYAGLEADYIEGIVAPELLKQKYPELDYLIGSVHFLELDTKGKLVEIDGSQTKFLEACESEGTVYLVKKYFAAIRQMIRTQPIDIVGHMDKIKIQNRRVILFNETESWYKEEIEHTIEVLKESSAILEINTRGLYKQITTEPYPSWWVIEKAIAQGIKLTLSSDTHHPKELQLGFDEVIKKLKQMDCDGLYFLRGGTWIKEMIQA